MTTDAAAQPQPPRTSDPPPPMPPSSLHAAAAAAAHEQPDPLPENVREYADIKYWDARFEREEQYDWLRRCAPPTHDDRGNKRPSAQLSFPAPREQLRRLPAPGGARREAQRPHTGAWDRQL